MWNNFIALKLHHHPQVLYSSSPNGRPYFCLETQSPFKHHVATSQFTAEGWLDRIGTGCRKRSPWLLLVCKVKGQSFPIHPLAVLATTAPCFSGQCSPLPLTAHSITITLNWT